MKNGEYLWQLPNWPNWQYDLAALVEPLAAASRAQGILIGRLADVGPALQDQAALAALTEEVVQTSAIEGEILNVASVRSALAHRLGVDIGTFAPVNRYIEGAVDIVLDATKNSQAPVTAERLYGWHAALFPTGHSGIGRINIGAWRNDSNGSMQVVSGPVGRQRVHYEAPPAGRINRELERFLVWLDRSPPESALIKAGIGHLWFITLHPLDDGNGRVARTISDLLIARADGSPQRFYSLSAQIQRERKAYYDILERTQKGSLNITVWLEWFLEALLNAVERANDTLDHVLAKAKFWRQVATVPMNERQIKVLNWVLSGFEGKLTTSKWASMAKCSNDTALRDITGLLQHGVLRKTSARGRSTSYETSMPTATVIN